MKKMSRDILPALIFQKMRSQAMSGICDGTDSIYSMVYMGECRWWIQEFQCQAILTRDEGHHTCGWWKNPDYERCWHLSMSFPGGRNPNTVDKILKGLFGENSKWLWIEPPYSDDGKTKEVYHYRLFCDKLWNPVKPRGEVYSKEFTEAGWKSYSEVQHELHKKADEQN